MKESAEPVYRQYFDTLNLTTLEPYNRFDIAVRFGLPYITQLQWK